MSENHQAGRARGPAEDDGRWASLDGASDDMGLASIGLNGMTAQGVSFENIYDEWFGRVSRWVWALGARGPDREDVVQEIFAVAYRQLHLFDGTNIAGWLYQIAWRKTRDYRQLAWVQRVSVSGGSRSFAAARHNGPGPLDELETKRKSELLKRRLEQLPPEQRTAFTLFELEGQSGHEIATRQQVPINTVWVRLHTARQKLKSHPERAQEKPQKNRRPTR